MINVPINKLFFFTHFRSYTLTKMASHSNGNMEQIMDVSVASSFGSPIMFNPSKRGLEASAGVLKDILLGMAIPVLESSREKYKIRNLFG